MDTELVFDDDYASLLGGIKTQIAASRTHLALSVNRDLLRLYWLVGRGIAVSQEQFGWGNRVVEQLASDLKSTFPDGTGFGRANLFRMRAFYLAHPDNRGSLDSTQIVAQPMRQLSLDTTLFAADALDSPPNIADLPWGHHVTLLEKLKDADARLWYAAQAMEHGWSRAVLAHQIESGLRERQGAAVTNFAARLPASESELAREMVKDPYVFDFLTLSPEAKERDLERSLIADVRALLLELGRGFAFVGSQYPLEVGGQDYYLGLLFYHTRLHCYVVVDLKIDDFKPEYAGKMNFYLSAVDELVKMPQDGLSIGLIICKSRNRTVAEYSLRDVSKPVGVAEYRLGASLPEPLRDSLPSLQELEERFKRFDEP